MTYGLLQSLVEADQNLLLYLNGFHNTFGDYFMPVFTGKWIWVPMYASILYVLLKNFNWKVVLFCLIGIALTITFADQVCATVIRPIVEPPCQTHCRPRTYRQRKTWRWFRLSLLPCFQLFWFSVLSGVPVPQTLAQYFHLYMGNR